MTRSITRTLSVFHPHEHTILSHWLGVDPPADTHPINTLPFDDETVAGVGLQSGDYPDGGLKTPVRNAVARIVLGAIEDRLPQWSTCDSEGNLTFARKLVERPSHKSRLIATVPRHLFTINWACSGPGFSWPEAYYLTWLPCYDVWVVTASLDSPEVHGYADLAIGWFNQDIDLIQGCCDVIRDQWWQGELGKYDQGRWEGLFGTGLVDGDTANEWADKVWCGPWGEVCL